jgi:hypothetical protein
LKIRFHEIPRDDEFFKDDPRWTALKEPSMNKLLLMANILGALLLVVIPLFFHFLVGINLKEIKSEMGSSLFLLIPLLVPLLFVHEWIHGLFFPDHGFSKKTCYIIMPKQLVAVAFYSDEISRTRMLTVFLAPFFFLTILPLAVCVFHFNLFLFCVGLLNACVAGGDLIGFSLVLTQVPAGGYCRNHGYQTFFRK